VDFQTEVVNVRLPRFRVEETTDLLEPIRRLNVTQVDSRPPWILSGDRMSRR
jgi:serine protease inhibitor